MFKKRFLLTSLLLLSLFLVPFADAKEGEVRLAGITITSDTYMLGVGWSNVIRKYLPGVRMVVLEKGGTTKLIRGMANKEWDIAFIGSPHLECAKNGILLFEPEKAYSKERYYDPTRALFAIYSGWNNYVVRADSGIHSIADLKGKRVHLGNPGGFGGIMTKGVFKGHGLDIDKGDYTGLYLATSQAMDQLRDKAGVDDVLVWGGIPQPLIADASHSIPLRFLSMTEEGFSKFQKEFVIGRFTLKMTLSPQQVKEAYKGRLVNAEPVHVWTIPMMVVVHKDMDEKLVYSLIKVFWEHVDEVKTVSNQLESISLKTGLTHLSAPFHPGALKYYKEIGAVK